MEGSLRGAVNDCPYLPNNYHNSWPLGLTDSVLVHSEKIVCLVQRFGP